MLSKNILSSTCLILLVAATVDAGGDSSAQQHRQLSSNFGARFSWSHLLYSMNVCSVPGKFCPTPKCKLPHEKKKPVCQVMAQCSSDSDSTEACAPACCDYGTLGSDAYETCTYMQSYTGVENQCSSTSGQSSNSYGEGEDNYNAYAEDSANVNDSGMATSGGSTRATDTINSTGEFNPMNYIIAALILVGIVGAVAYRRSRTSENSELSQELTSKSSTLSGAVSSRLEGVESGSIPVAKDLDPVTRAASSTHFVTTGDASVTNYNRV